MTRAGKPSKITQVVRLFAPVARDGRTVVAIGRYQGRCVYCYLTATGEQWAI